MQRRQGFEVNAENWPQKSGWCDMSQADISRLYICANIYSAKLNTIKSFRLEEIN